LDLFVILNFKKVKKWFSKSWKKTILAERIMSYTKEKSNI